MAAGVANGQEAAPSVGPGTAVAGSPSPSEASGGVVSGSQKKGYTQDALSPDPQAILGEALRILQVRRSITAKIRQEIDLFDNRLVGSGNYFEQLQGRDHLVRLELKIQHGEQTSSLVQVAAMPDADGRRFLWTKRKVLDKEELSRVDLDQVAQQLQEADGITPRAVQLGILQAEGGLGKILAGFRDCFDFTEAELGRLGKQGGLVWRLQGQWKPEQLARVLGESSEDGKVVEPPDPSRLPPHLPDRVVVHLRHEDLFPYRIEYRRTVSPQTTRPVVTMEFYDVFVDVAVSEKTFVYNPGDLDFIDNTAEYVDSLLRAH